MNTPPKLTPRENFLRMMQGRSPERIPLDMTLSPPVAEKIAIAHPGSSPHEVIASDFRGIWPRFTDRSKQWLDAYRSLGVKVPDGASIDDFGVCTSKPKGNSLGACTHMSQLVHLLAQTDSVKAISKLPWPDMDNPALYTGLRKEVEAIHQQGYVAVGPMTCSVFEHSWYLRSMETLFMDWIEDGEVGQWLMEWFTERTCAAVRAYCKSGVDVVFLGDDIGSQQDMLMSLEMWRTHLKPRLKRIVDTVRQNQKEKVWIAYHTDGAVQRIIPELFELGIDLLNPVQPECMDIHEILGTHANKGAFWGMIGTQTTMPFGSVEIVQEKAREVLAHAAKGVRMVVGPTHLVEPDVPLANIYALRDEIRQFRF